MDFLKQKINYLGLLDGGPIDSITEMESTQFY